MSKWYYNLNGEPIAFQFGDQVFKKDGQFLGQLKGERVFHRVYRGEIFAGDRLIYRQGCSFPRCVEVQPEILPDIPPMPEKRTVTRKPPGSINIRLDEFRYSLGGIYTYCNLSEEEYDILSSGKEAA